MYIFTYHVSVNLGPELRKSLFDAYQRALDHFEALIRRGVASGDFRTDAPALVAHNIINAASSWALKRWYLHTHYTLEEYTEAQTHLVLKSLGFDDRKSASSRHSAAPADSSK